ncbi:MAG: CDC48 family AAA ATPase [Candidatus Brockarchaeota archaeon]|nr:CDC48 family AAA ATPase [Candidatus Brockarchaeota archaeon]
MSEIQLVVAEARPRDVGRRIVRIGRKEMAQLKAETGDVVEILGRKSASAVVWPGYAEDEDRKIVRMDGLIRKSAGVAIGDYVKIRKVDKVENANEVVLAPMGARISSVDEDFLDYVRDKLIDTPLTEGDIVAVPVFGGQALGLTVVRVKPRGFVKVTPDTRMQIVSEEAAEKLAIPRVTYEDIGGLHEEIQRIREMVELPLRHPELFQRLGIEPPKGVLLHGPPGTGKTLLAKAVANESDANFLSINGPEIMSKFYGESEERLRRVFQEAQEKAPSIIFIDEIDAIAPKREEVGGEVERRVVAQLLALMDGLKARGDVIVIGATNVPNMIDPALRRPGRFDREIEIGVPDKQGRLEILQIHTRSMPLDKDVDLKKLAEITHGYTGADLAALCREAAMKALRRYLPEIKLDERIPQSVLEKMVVKAEDFMNAFKEITPSAMREVYVEVPTVRWSDVGGLEEIKRRLRETVELPIKTPEKFEKLGITPPKAILLYGPPGCGKTLLARAVATESEANFISIKGPEIFSKWVGESEKAIREVFRKARLASPSIIFLDEVDAIAPRRGMSMADSGVTERVVSQLLTEMDGLTPIERIVIIGATNRPELLDPAIMRPGRFEVVLYVPPPDEASRLQILKIHTRRMPLEGVSLEEIAKRTEGYSGADLEALCREAGLNALRRDADKVTKEDFEKALQTIKPSLKEEMLAKYKKFGEKEEFFLV